MLFSHLEKLWPCTLLFLIGLTSLNGNVALAQNAKSNELPTVQVTEINQADIVVELRKIRERITRIEAILANLPDAKKLAADPRSVASEIADDSPGDSGSLLGNIQVGDRLLETMFRYQHGSVFAPQDVPAEALKAGNVRITLRGNLLVPRAMKVKIMMAGGGVSHDVNWLYVDGKQVGSVGDDRQKHLIKELDLTMGEYPVKWILTAGTFQHNILMFRDAETNDPLRIIALREDLAAAKSAKTLVEIKSQATGWPIPRDWK